MSGYILSAAVEFDLDEIWEYIAADNIDAADRWIGKLFDAFEALGQRPGIGHRREDLTDYPVLFWPVGAYLNHLPRRTAAYRDRGRDPRLTRHPRLPESAHSPLRGCSFARRLHYIMFGYPMLLTRCTIEAARNRI